jgi:flagellar hook assembly protein FlgD
VGVVAVTTIAPVAPVGLQLAPARPDPFRGTTALTFDVARRERVIVTVHDVAGRRVATLANRTFAAGRHTLSWNGVDETGTVTPAGVYFVRAATDEASVGRRITRIR